MRIILCVYFLLLSSTFVQADWKHWGAEPTPFTSTDSYIIAVGAKDQRVDVKAGDIEDALKKGKEVRLKYAKVIGALGYGGKIEKDVYFIDTYFEAMVDFEYAQFTGEAYFRSAKFKRIAYFKNAQFTREANFGYAKFKGIANFKNAQFTGEAKFEYAKFKGIANFKNAQFTGEAKFGSAEFKGIAGFENVKFTELAFYFSAKFKADASFRSTEFKGKADFGSVKFTKLAFFFSAEFKGEAKFGSAEFKGKADFWYTRFTKLAFFFSAEFTELANFGYAQFTGEADFGSAEFTELASFWYARFNGDADFKNVEFKGITGFENAKFTELAFFFSAKFTGKASFGRTEFNREAYFDSAKFSSYTDFSNTIFKGKTDFSKCQFPVKNDNENAISEEKPNIMDFSRTTGFSNMIVEWEQSNNVKDPTRGLKNHIQYDRIFFLALMKNYRELGFLPEANDVEFVYRQNENRKREPLVQWAERIFLEWPFGYGVKPSRLLYTFLILLVFFTLFYRLTLKYDPRKNQRPQNWKPWRRLLAYFLRSIHPFPFLWAFFHSLNNQTAGIKWDFLENTILKRIPYTYNEDSPWSFSTRAIQVAFGWYFLVLFVIMFSKLWIR